MFVPVNPAAEERSEEARTARAFREHYERTLALATAGDTRAAWDDVAAVLDGELFAERGGTRAAVLRDVQLAFLGLAGDLALVHAGAGERVALALEAAEWFPDVADVWHALGRALGAPDAPQPGVWAACRRAALANAAAAAPLDRVIRRELMAVSVEDCLVTPPHGRALEAVPIAVSLGSSRLSDVVAHVADAASRLWGPRRDALQLLAPVRFEVVEGPVDAHGDSAQDSQAVDLAAEDATADDGAVVDEDRTVDEGGERESAQKRRRRTRDAPERTLSVADALARVGTLCAGVAASPEWTRVVRSAAEACAALGRARASADAPAGEDPLVSCGDLFPALRVAPETHTAPLIDAVAAVLVLAADVQPATRLEGALCRLVAAAAAADHLASVVQHLARRDAPGALVLVAEACISSGRASEAHLALSLVRPAPTTPAPLCARRLWALYRLRPDAGVLSALAETLAAAHTDATPASVPSLGGRLTLAAVQGHVRREEVRAAVARFLDGDVGGGPGDGRTLAWAEDTRPLLGDSEYGRLVHAVATLRPEDVSRPGADAARVLSAALQTASFGGDRLLVLLPADALPALAPAHLRSLVTRITASAALFLVRGLAAIGSLAPPGGASPAGTACEAETHPAWALVAHMMRDHAGARAPDVLHVVAACTAAPPLLRYVALRVLAGVRPCALPADEALCPGLVRRLAEDAAPVCADTAVVLYGASRAVFGGDRIAAADTRSQSSSEAQSGTASVPADACPGRDAAAQDGPGDEGVPAESLQSRRRPSIQSTDDTRLAAFLDALLAALLAAPLDASVGAAESLLFAALDTPLGAPAPPLVLRLSARVRSDPRHAAVAGALKWRLALSTRTSQGMDAGRLATLAAMTNASPRALAALGLAIDASVRADILATEAHLLLRAVPSLWQRATRALNALLMAGPSAAPDVCVRTCVLAAAMAEGVLSLGHEALSTPLAARVILAVLGVHANHPVHSEGALNPLDDGAPLLGIESFAHVAGGEELWHAARAAEWLAQPRTLVRRLRIRALSSLAAGDSAADRAFVLRAELVADARDLAELLETAAVAHWHSVDAVDAQIDAVDAADAPIDLIDAADAPMDVVGASTRTKIDAEALRTEMLERLAAEDRCRAHSAHVLAAALRDGGLDAWVRLVPGARGSRKGGATGGVARGTHLACDYPGDVHVRAEESVRAFCAHVLATPGDAPAASGEVHKALAALALALCARPAAGVVRRKSLTLAILAALEQCAPRDLVDSVSRVVYSTRF